MIWQRIPTTLVSFLLSIVKPNRHTQTIDELLFEQMVQGSEQAYYDLFDRHWERLYAIAWRLLNDSEAAKDVVQEVFLNLWERRSTLEVQNAAAYLSRAAKFKALNHLRDHPSDRLRSLEEAVEQSTGESAPLDLSDLQLELSDALNGLPERCRQVFLLSREEQLSNQEIAEQLNLSQRTVETHISNALKHLRKHLGRGRTLALIMTLAQL